MQILRHADYKRMPWKNGLGVTEEVIAFPPGSDLATFGWRLSIAHVGADGPFSVFAGIDRTIALLNGEGMVLDIPGRTVELSPAGQPFAFSGDLRISSRNRSGPTIDLNIMTRRCRYTHTMRRIGGGTLAIASRDTILVFNTAATLSRETETITLERFDALLVGIEDGPIALPENADVLLIEVSSV